MFLKLTLICYMKYLSDCGACHNFNFTCQQEPQTSHLTSSRGRLEQAEYWCDLNTNKEGSKDEDYFLNSTLSIPH